MTMSEYTNTYITGGGQGMLTGAAAGAVAGGESGLIAGLPGVIVGGLLGAGLGLLGASSDVKNQKAQAEALANNDPTTPYRVTLPSGAVITMYAHGKPKAVGEYSSSTAAINDVAKTYAALNQKTPASTTASPNVISPTTTVKIPDASGGILGLSSY
jgi:phage tail tape-measure protein